MEGPVVTVVRDHRDLLAASGANITSSQGVHSTKSSAELKKPSAYGAATRSVQSVNSVFCSGGQAVTIFLFKCRAAMMTRLSHLSLAMEQVPWTSIPFPNLY